MQQLSIHAKILSPIHVRSGRERDGLDFFLEEEHNLLHIIDQHRIEKAISQEKVEKDTLLDVISLGKFKQLAEIKSGLGKNFFDIVASFDIEDKAKKTLGQMGNSANRGIIKQHSCHPFTGEPIIPGSTLKGIFRTAFLYDYLEQKRNGNMENEEEIIKKFNNEKLNQSLFQWLQFEDSIVEESTINIQVVEAITKPKKKQIGNKPKKGIPLNMQTLVEGTFQIHINILPNKQHIDVTHFQDIIKQYSELLISREEKIIDGIGYGSDFLDILDNFFEAGKYPIKIGMFKKSIAYKLWREEMLEKMNHECKGKKRLDESRRRQVGDKTLYLSENKTPVGRIVLDFDV